MQRDVAWQDDRRRVVFMPTYGRRLRLQGKLRAKLLRCWAACRRRAPLNPRITSRIPMAGFTSRSSSSKPPGIYVTALVRARRRARHPAVLVACGHSANGKAHYQALCQRLAARVCRDLLGPVGQGERSQFWDASG